MGKASCRCVPGKRRGRWEPKKFPSVFGSPGYRTRWLRIDPEQSSELTRLQHRRSKVLKYWPIWEVHSYWYAADIVRPILIRSSSRVCGRWPTVHRHWSRRRRVRPYRCRCGRYFIRYPPVIVEVIYKIRVKLSREDPWKRVRSLILSHIPSCSACRRPVIRFVFPHRRKSASFSCPMNACLHDSMFGDKRSLSVGGAARCRIRRKGVVCWSSFSLFLREEVIMA